MEWNSSLGLILGMLSAIVSYLVYSTLFKVEFSPIVPTRDGELRGSLAKSRLGKDFYQFRGVPYAQPPLGELRFSSPKPPTSWVGVRDVVEFGSKCLQVDGFSRAVTGSEDCLTLNVFVPKNTLPSTDAKGTPTSGSSLLPVIFYIHGGYFMVGSSSYMGPEYIMDENIILVTINYRLNVFGFLNTEDCTATGNFGLKDQRLALNWVQQNIRNFGGDATKVTLAGQSAGSAAVHLHLLSSGSKGLFSSALMSSGTAVKPWSWVSNPRAQADNLAQLVNCPTSSSAELVKCLRSIDAPDLLYPQKDALGSPIMDPLEIFAPSQEKCSDCQRSDTCFMTEHPYDILTGGKKNRIQVPILMGVNKDEGLLASARMYFNHTLTETVAKNWKNLFPKLFLYDPHANDVTGKIRNFYTGDTKDGELDVIKFFPNITNALSDRLYFHAAKESVKIHAKESPVYLYYFTYPVYRGMTYFYDIDYRYPLVPQFVWKELVWHLNEWVFQRDNVFLGVGHGDDIALIFKLPLIDLSPKSRDFRMSREMVKMWTSFASDAKSLQVGKRPWDPVAVPPNGALAYKLISKDAEMHGSLIEEPFTQRLEFWDKLNLPWKT